jgi:pyridoxine/pyridoxamine 5'-phosphate oxidase
MNPVESIQVDRTEARQLGDSNADICFLALADSSGNASVRTLVLREITENRFTLFINKSSPKWKALTSGASLELLIWYSSLQHQYRVSGSVRELDPEIVKSNWQHRPIGSKYLDHVYQELGDQSSTIPTRETLTEKIKQMKATLDPEDMKAPSFVAGVEIIADRIEMLDLSMEDRIHDRQVHKFDGSDWTSEILIP